MLLVVSSDGFVSLFASWVTGQTDYFSFVFKTNPHSSSGNRNGHEISGCWVSLFLILQAMILQHNISCKLSKKFKPQVHFSPWCCYVQYFHTCHNPRKGLSEVKVKEKCLLLLQTEQRSSLFDGFQQPFTAPFNNMWNLKFKSPTKVVFLHAVNQGGASVRKWINWVQLDKKLIFFAMTGRFLSFFIFIFLFSILRWLPTYEYMFSNYDCGERKNTTVGGDLNFRFGMLLKGAGKLDRWIPVNIIVHVVSRHNSFYRLSLLLDWLEIK